MFKIQIKKKLDINKLLSILEKYKKEDIECTRHTLFRFSEKQRKIFTCDELIEILR